MAKHLVVVESPAKARTINKILGSGYIVKASNGHVRDLPKNELGVDLEHDFAPKYVRLREAAKPVKAIKDAAAKVDHILLASDPDREGEAIGWHMAQLLKGCDKPIERIVFNAITKRNVREATRHPRPIDEDLVNAQQARRILDRLVGYKISPLLQFGIQRGLSAGRVQSVAVRIVCDREAEIRAFVPKEFWTLDALLKTRNDEGFVARLHRIADEKAEIGSEAAMQKVLGRIEGAEYRVASVERKEVRRNPAPPFITSSLQQEASRRLRLSPRATMRIAQTLYEGVALGAEGSTGLITYMRTDSTRTDPEGIEEVRDYIAKHFEAPMLPAKPNVYVGKKGAQDAHEAIRPTAVERTPDSIRQYLNEDQFKLYSLIWVRFVASQMASAVLDQTTVDVAARDCVFRATGSVMKFPGFTKLYEERAEEDAKNANGKAGNGAQAAAGPAQQPLPAVSQGDPLALEELKPEQRFTKPPSRYTEASLIRALEENGIGRPSTYAPTMNTIMERGYVEREKGRLKPTQLGEDVNALLVQNFPDILDVSFTARLEEDLDRVEDGSREWHDLLRVFYGDFARALEAAQGRIVENVLGKDAKCEKCGAPLEAREGRFGLFIACRNYPECRTTHRIGKRAEPEQTDEVCDQCGAPMVIREGRYGKFLACSKYPKCKNTFNIDENGNKVAKTPKAAPKKTDQKCPKCGAFLVIRQARGGDEFYGCENYPKCKFTKPKELGLKCVRPGCDGNLVTKRAKGRRFVGCDRYPKCDFTLFGVLDRDAACPKCGNSWTAVVKERNKPRKRKCPVPTCDYEEEVPEETE